VYVSWYFSPKSAQMEIPESYRMSRESFVYSVFRMDLMRRFEISDDKVVFRASHDDQFLLDHLRQLTGEPITEAQLEQWREEHRRDSDAFSAYMGELYTDIYQGG
jgi:hypothetical protein